MSSVVISGDTSGTVTLSVPAVSGTNTATLPAATGTVMVSGNMPAFSAYLGTNQNLTNNAFTKIQINTENFDTNSNYDNATNYRFTPTVAGYYQINGRVDSQSSTGSVTRCIASIYRNGTEYKRGSDVNTANTNASNVVDVVYFNGSTDYVELYGFISAAVTATAGATQALTYFSGSMVRGA
jgi:hypothetical protein